MNITSSQEESPILLIPYMWIGDFVRCHSVVKLLKAQTPKRPIDFLTTALCAPLLNYMPGVRKGIVWDLPRGHLPLEEYVQLARQLRREHYGTAIVMPRTWKSALLPFLAGIPQRTGFVGEFRFGLINDLRFGERRLERMVDRMGALALPAGTPAPAEWPLPELVVPKETVTEWRARQGLDASRAVALCPGAVGPGKAWPPAHYADLARRLAAKGLEVWVLGGPREKALAADIVTAGGPKVRDLTSPDLGNAVVTLAAADATVTNDSGLMHVAAALSTPTVAIFGPTSPRLWGPLNPLAAVLEPPGETADIRQRRTADVHPDRVFAALKRVLRR